MSGPEILVEVAALSAGTWNSKVLNILRLLDDNSYAGLYSWIHVGDALSIAFSGKTFDIDLSSDTTERQVLVAIDDYFGSFEHDRSYKREGEADVEL